MKLYLLLIMIVSKLICFAQDTTKPNIRILDSFRINYGEKFRKDVIVRKLISERISLFQADMDVDLDGCPEAYHPLNYGLEKNGNAIAKKSRRYSHSVLLHIDDTPVIQDSTDKNPGYFISKTSLQTTAQATKSIRYVNSLEIPYVVLPYKLTFRLGDIVLVYNTINNNYSFSIYADANNYVIGEGSAKLADKLGLKKSKRDYYYCGNCKDYRSKNICYKCSFNIDSTVCKKCKLEYYGNDKKSFVYIVFEGSSFVDRATGLIDLKNLTEQEIEKQGNLLVDKYGGVESILSKVLPLTSEHPVQ